MQLGVISVAPGQRQSVLTGLVTQLLVQVEPLQDPLPIQELAPAELAKLVPGNGLALLSEVLPQLQQTDEVGFGIAETPVRLVRRGLCFERPFAGILDAQGSRQDQQVFQAALPAALFDHPRQADIHRPMRQAPAQSGGRPGLVNRLELVQQVVGIIDHPWRRRIDERKLLDDSQAHGQHSQDDRGQRGPQDFRLGKLRPAGEIFCAVEPHTGSGTEPPAAPGPLVRAGLGNRLDRQALDATAMCVAADAGEPRIDYEPDAWHRERGFSDVGGQDDAALGTGVKDATLLRGRQPGEQR